MNKYILHNLLLDEFIYHSKFQWINPLEVGAGETALRNTDVLNIGLVGGLFQPRGYWATSLGSIWFTSSRMSGALSGGRLRTERGLLDMEFESFTFIRTERDSYPTDINSVANEEMRSTFKERGARLLGYVRERVPLFDFEGNIIEENLFSEPPTDAAYTEWYGFKYLYYEQISNGEMPLPVDIYMMLFEAVQKIRRIGISIQSLLDITTTLGEGYMYNLEIVKQTGNWWYTVYYDLDEKKQLEGRERRYMAWIYIMMMKFKFFTFIDRATLG
jgi:hypothetical protein